MSTNWSSYLEEQSYATPDYSYNYDPYQPYTPDYSGYSYDDGGGYDPSYAPEPAYDPSNYDATGNYTGGYEPEPYVAPAPVYTAPEYTAPDYQPPTPDYQYEARQPAFDPGYTIGEQAGGGYSPPPAYDPQAQLPPGQNALQALDFGPFSDRPGGAPAPAYQPPDTRWLPPAIDPSRNPLMPAPAPASEPQAATEAAWQEGTSQAYTEQPENPYDITQAGTPVTSAAEAAALPALDPNGWYSGIEANRLKPEPPPLIPPPPQPAADATLSDVLAATSQGPQIVADAEAREDLFGQVERDQAWRQGNLRQGIPDPFSYDATGGYGGYDPAPPQDTPILGWLGDRASDLGAAASNLQQSALGQAAGGALGAVGDTAYRGFDALRDNAMSGLPSAAQQAGLGGLFSFVEPDTPFLGGIQQAVTGIGANLGQAQNLQEVLGAFPGAIDTPDQWWRRQQAEWAAQVLRGEGDWYRQIVDTLPTEQVPALGKAAESPMEWVTTLTPEQQAIALQVYEQNGPDAFWEFYQSHRNMAQRGFADVMSPWMLLHGGRALTGGAAGLARIAKSSTNPALRAAGRVAEPAFNATGAVLGSVEAAEDLGLTTLGGWAGRRVRNWAPFRLTDEAQADLNVDTRLDTADDTVAAWRAAGSPAAPDSPNAPGGAPPNGSIPPEFSDQRTTTTTRYGDYRVVQRNDTGEAIVTDRERSRVLTPHPLTAEEAEAVLAEIRAGATIEEAVAYGESLRVARQAPADPFAAWMPSGRPAGQGQYPTWPSDQPQPTAWETWEGAVTPDRDFPTWPSGTEPRRAGLPDQPDPRTRGEAFETVIDDETGEPLEVLWVSDATGRYWLENPDTRGIIYGPMSAEDAAAQQIHAARIVQDERVRRGNQAVTATTEITGGWRAPTARVADTAPGTISGPPDVAEQPLSVAYDPADSSYTVSAPDKVAAEYAESGVTLDAEIPVERVLSTGLSGMGERAERELSVLGGEMPSAPSSQVVPPPPTHLIDNAAPRGRWGTSRTIPIDPNDIDGPRRPVTTDDLRDAWSRQFETDAADYDAAGARAWRAEMFDQKVIARDPDLNPRGFDGWARLEAEQYIKDPTATQARWDRPINETGLDPIRQQWVKDIATEIQQGASSPAAARNVRQNIPPEQAQAARDADNAFQKAEAIRTGKSQKRLGIVGNQPNKQGAREFHERGLAPGATAPAQVPGAAAAPLAPGQRALDDLRAMSPEVYDTPTASAQRRDMYQGGFLRKSAPVAAEDAGIRQVGDRWQVYNTRTNHRLTGKDYATRDLAEQAQARRAELAAGQQTAYGRFVDAQVARMRTHGPDAVAQSLRAEKVPAATIRDITARAKDEGLTVSESPLPPAPNGQALDLTTGERVVDPNPNPANRLGIAAPTAAETAQAGFGRGQSLRERAARPAQVRNTLGQAPDPAATAKYRNLPIPSQDLALLQQKMPKTQGLASDRDFGDALFEAVDDVAEAVTLAQRRGQGQLSTKQEARLTALAERYGLAPDDLSLLDEAAQDRLIRGQIEATLKRELAPAGKEHGPVAQALGDFWTGTKQFLRSFALYNWLRVPAYINTNLLGNAVTASLKPDNLIGKGGYFDPVNGDAILRRVIQEGRGEVPANVSAYEKIAQGLGHKPRTTVVGAAHKDQLDFLWAARSKNKLARAASKALLSEPGYLLAQGADQIMREAVTMPVARRALPAMVRELRTAAKDAARRMGVLVNDEQIDTAIDALVRAGRAESPGLPTFSAQQVKDALGALPVNGGPSPAAWADRVHRDWREATSRLMNDMDAATEKWAFSFRKTNADEFLGNFIKFHVWASRASKLYVSEALRNPWLIAAYLNATEGLEKYKEEHNLPGSLRNFVSLFQGVGGFHGFIEPQFFMPALLAATEDAYRNEGEWGLTKAGEIIGFINQKLPILDVWRAFTYYSGIEGGGNLAPDPFYGWRDSLGALANVVNASGWLGAFGLEMADEAGLLPAPVRTLSNRAAHAISGWFVDRLPDVGLKQVPLQSEELLRDEYALRQIVADLVAQRNPGATPDEQSRLIDEAMADPAGDLYQEAYGQWVNVDLAKAGARLVMPLPSRIRNEAQDERRLAIQQGTAEERQAAYDIDAAVRRASPEDAAYETNLAEYDAMRDDVGHDLWGTYDRIADGGVRSSFRLNGQDYYSSDLAAMTEGERRELANAWLEAMGARLGIDARARMDARYDAQNAYLDEHPDIAAMVEFRDRAEEYGSGVTQFILDTAEVNRPYAQYLDTIDEPVGSPEWIDKATNRYTAAQAVQGQAWDIFNPIQDPEGAGYVAGLPRETELHEARAIRQQEREAEWEARQAEYAEGQAEWTDYVEDTSTALMSFNEDLTERIQVLRDAGVPEADIEVYLSRVAFETEGRLDSHIYAPLRDAFGGDNIYPYPKNAEGKRNSAALDYWAARRHDPTLVLEDFLSQRSKEKKAEREAFSPETDLAGVPAFTGQLPADDQPPPPNNGFQTWGELSGPGAPSPASSWSSPSLGGPAGVAQRAPGQIETVPVPTTAYHERGGAQPVGIVYHITGDDDINSTFQHFLDPANEASSHYVVDLDGTIYEMVDPDDAAWTQGDVKNPVTHIPWVNQAVATGQNLNDVSFGIEFVNANGGQITPEQYAAGVALTQWLGGTYGVPIDPLHVIGHRDINSVDRDYDPGPYFPMDEMIRDAAGGYVAR